MNMNNQNTQKLEIGPSIWCTLSGALWRRFVRILGWTKWKFMWSSGNICCTILLYSLFTIYIYYCVSCKGYNIGFALPIFQNDTCVSCAGYSDELAPRMLIPVICTCALYWQVCILCRKHAHSVTALIHHLLQAPGQDRYSPVTTEPPSHPSWEVWMYYIRKFLINLVFLSEYTCS